jgi:acyl-CoA thioesterase I
MVRSPIARLLTAVGVVWLSIAGCGRGNQNQPQPATEPFPVGQNQDAANVPTAIAFLGDSLTAGLGLTTTQAYPALIEEMFHNEGYEQVEVINAGVTGDTTAGGLRRLEQALEPNVRIVVVALGGNDALRGLSTTQTNENLTAIVEGALNSGVEVLLAGMEAPTNLGEDYRDRFRGVFLGLSSTYRRRIHYMPFLLEGVAGDPALNQPDGIHPNAQGAKIIAEHMYPMLRDMIDQLPRPGSPQ